jgi:two-component system OmpR family sensor kinase
VTKPASAGRKLKAPIAAQIVALLIGGVLLGQVMTLIIVLLVPPPRPDVYRLTEIASALNGQTVHPKDGRDLVRAIGAPPPIIAPPNRHSHFQAVARHQLAGLLGVSMDRVRFGVERGGRPPWEWAVLGAPVSPPADDNRPPAEERGPPPPGEPPPGEAPQGGPPPGEGPPGGLRHWWRSPQAMFGGDRAPLVFDDFTAALEQSPGQWVVVSPKPDPFPFVWQARIVAWLLVCLAVFGPAGYLFARRFVAPITAFAEAADRLGRDPRASLVSLDGPAEIGVAARAFNEMQARLKRYVEDRTTMIGAISHDLRTPLTRIRFKMEGGPPDLRRAVGSDIDQMEAMISAALAFVRDASQPHEREVLDLLSVLECVVDDARSGGGDVVLAIGDPLAIDGDALALQRLFANLVDNAVKYGHEARVGLTADAGDAVVQVTDAGPGLPAAELERVFEPFYRTEPSRNRDTGGIGLGLAVARSVARAHGGDVVLRSTATGLIAEVRLPLARTPETPPRAEPARQIEPVVED